MYYNLELGLCIEFGPIFGSNPPCAVAVWVQILSRFRCKSCFVQSSGKKGVKQATTSSASTQRTSSRRKDTVISKHTPLISTSAAMLLGLNNMHVPAPCLQNRREAGSFRPTRSPQECSIREECQNVIECSTFITFFVCYVHFARSRAMSNSVKSTRASRDLDSPLAILSPFPSRPFATLRSPPSISSDEHGRFATM